MRSGRIALSSQKSSNCQCCSLKLREYIRPSLFISYDLSEQIDRIRNTDLKTMPTGKLKVLNHRSQLVVMAILFTFTWAVADADAQPGRDGIWTSPAELADLQMSGPAWERLKADADAPLKAQPNLSERNREGVQVFAKALVYARTGIESYRQEVINAVMLTMGTEGGDALATFRALGTYVIAADLAGLPPADDIAFRAWLKKLLDPHHRVGTRSLVGCHEKRANNWGTHAGASRAAIAAYLENSTELARSAQVFKGYLGDRTVYAGFRFGKDLSWQADPDNPVGINPKGATKEGHSIDGVLPDDQRRCGRFQWPPCLTNYAWEGLQGVLAQAVILGRAGYDVWAWQDQAILRAVKWLYHAANYPAEGDDTWQPHIINYYYGTNFPASIPARGGKNVGFADWTHGSPKFNGNGASSAP
jgi:hypothetical protein